MCHDTYLVKIKNKSKISVKIWLANRVGKMHISRTQMIIIPV